MSRGLVVATICLTCLSTATGFILVPSGYLSPLVGPGLIGATGGITGVVTIGPVNPVCTAYYSYTPVPSYYSQIGAVITPASGLPVTVPVNWILQYGCWVHGTFKTGLNPGAYSVTLTSCQLNNLMIPVSKMSLGCSKLPITAIVTSNAWTQVVITFPTGIE